MEYRLATPSSASFLPLSFKPTVTIGSAGGAFQFTITSKTPSSRPLEEIRINFRIGDHASAVQATISGGQSSSSLSSRLKTNSGLLDGGGATTELAGGRWEFDAVSSLLTWHISKMSSLDKPAVLEGTFNSSIFPCRQPATAVQISFRCPLTNVSGIQVTSLKVASNGVGADTQLYKGVRPMMKSGKLEFRW